MDEEQPFYYICNQCNSATRGKLVIWYEPTVGAKLELEDGELYHGFDRHDQAISIHPDFPAIHNAAEMSEPGGSPFLTHRTLLGDNFEEFHERYHCFRSFVKDDWVPLRRLISYYLDRNWKQLDQQGKKILNDKWPQNDIGIKRHDVIHRIIDVFFAPLLIRPIYPEMKLEWNFIFNTAVEKCPIILEKYITEVVDHMGVQNLQRDVFHCIDLFVANKSSILPGLATSMYQSHGNGLDNDFRLFRDDFPVLRDIYITTFEVCHKSLQYIVAIKNLAVRGNYNYFEGSKPKNLVQFAKLANAKKVNNLDNLPVWDSNWTDLLNRTVRNSIGHSSVRHDLSRGQLMLKSDSTISYINFVTMCFNLIHPLLACANVLKTICIAKTLIKHCRQ